ncbi:MAG TPA: hypothetical protein VKA30_12040 [Actinomycetota bacterium]|nr:hypothetical protein [Actinomycetota bacterium]
MPAAPVGRRLGFVAAALSASVFLTASGAAAARLPAIPIPQDPRESGGVPAFVGHVATPAPVAAPAVPQHPFMAPNGSSNIHDDAYQTDTYTTSGPLGDRMAVDSSFLAADCASVTFDRLGRIVTVCVGLQGPFLAMLDPRTLAAMALFPLPLRIPSPSGGSPFSDFAGGGYFYLDHLDRAVIPTTTRQIWVVAEARVPVVGQAFRLVRRYDLTRAVPFGDGIVSALPDWSGRIWFVSSGGVVGTVDRGSGRVRSLRLRGEVIANSFAVDETGGVYVVSDHALYRFDAGSNGGPVVTWREPYDRGTRIKPGQVSQGSGTTPSLMGSEYVAITDNADPRMHVVVYRRARDVSGTRLVCAEPVFAAGKGDTENSLVVTGTSMIVENNYGYSNPLATENGRSTEPGLARVDLDAEGQCHTVWVSGERAPSVVPKLSLATGLLYTYTKDPSADGTDAWYFTAIDFVSGATVYKRLAGAGLGFNNNYAPVTLGPDGAAYVGALGGIVRLADSG